MFVYQLLLINLRGGQKQNTKRGAENGRNISNSLNSDRTDGRICDDTQESLSQRVNQEEHIMESIPQFSYWFNRKSKIIYRVYNMSLTDITHYDNNDNPVKGGWNNKLSLTSINSFRRR